MHQQFHLTPINLSDSTTLDSLVEHRRVFNLPNCELNIFETFHQCTNVALSYNGLVVSSMMRGKKIMSLTDTEKFDFLPGESVIIPEGVTMKVDFPEADTRHPVQCATLALDWGMVNKNIDFLNEHYPNNPGEEWKLNFSKYHFMNNKELAISINKLIGISMENDVAKDALADLSLKFLLLRIIQTQNLAILDDASSLKAHRFTPVIHYIKEHLSEKITIDILAKESYMSKSAFFNTFKAEFGIPPLEYVLRERIRQAKRLMADPSISITEVCYQSGFNNPNYFIKLFRRFEGVTPAEYRK